MDESEIAGRASTLRQQAICRLNGIEHQESPVTAKNPQPPNYEPIKASWARSDIDYQRLTILLTAALVISNAYSLYVGESQRSYLLGTTKSNCISDVTIQRSGGKSPTPYFNDAQGRKVASCSQFRCSYNNWRSDVGKTAKICLSDDVVVSIEIEGIQKVSRDILIARLENIIWWSEFWLGLGGICLAIFAFVKRKKWREFIRSPLSPK